MNRKEEKIITAAVVASMVSFPVLLVFLIFLRVDGAIDWPLRNLTALSAVPMFIVYAVLEGLSLCAELKRRIRRRKTDRRVIRQAKAIGVWEKPWLLGGRALELRAWKDYKIKRQPGETDKQLRSRYMTELCANPEALIRKTRNQRKGTRQ